MEIKKVRTGSDMLEQLGYQIIHLVSEGKTETVDNVIEHLVNKDIVNYIITTYKDNLTVDFNSDIFGLDGWEEVLFENHSYISFNSDVRRKMGIYNEDKDGLLVLLNIILQEVSDRRYNLE